MKGLLARMKRLNKPAILLHNILAGGGGGWGVSASSGLIALAHCAAIHIELYFVVSGPVTFGKGCHCSSTAYSLSRCGCIR